MVEHQIVALVTRVRFPSFLPMNKKEKLKELKNKCMLWCENCEARAYDYLNPCSGYQQEKCQREAQEWLRREVNELWRN